MTLPIPTGASASGANVAAPHDVAPVSVADWYIMLHAELEQICVV